jgi:hypothetical protein
MKKNSGLKKQEGTPQVLMPRSHNNSAEKSPTDGIISINENKNYQPTQSILA